MNKILTYIFVVFGVSVGISQVDEEALKEAEQALESSTDYTYDGNKNLTQNNFIVAETDYRKAISKSRENVAAPYNLGRAYYNRESFIEAFGSFKDAGTKAKEKPDKHRAFHNLGNVFMKSQEFAKAVEAYKEALRANPNDDETRYNLALAKKNKKSKKIRKTKRIKRTTRTRKTKTTKTRTKTKIRKAITIKKRGGRPKG